ncbi:uncharacterized protein BDZ99DRAFT_558164 [Mytilinidion resinicola]|uniref:Uncharacterized protein n=1 Tax=Mytilinidion resinicola TaxID=574789 RepID=A0A6A6YUU3_9PEZI|nr:uncharacterized protein BDZ99DRAFT_558164 [Mytilinidion resinicola]KAF2812299.1 hypothetical protein BDZ99DRAFT_558164 [Mytilinidion resinicola]
MEEISSQIDAAIFAVSAFAGTFINAAASTDSFYQSCAFRCRGLFLSSTSIATPVYHPCLATSIASSKSTRPLFAVFWYHSYVSISTTAVPRTHRSKQMQSTSTANNVTTLRQTSTPAMDLAPGHTSKTIPDSTARRNGQELPYMPTLNAVAIMLIPRQPVFQKSRERAGTSNTASASSTTPTQVATLMATPAMLDAHSMSTLLSTEQKEILSSKPAEYIDHALGSGKMLPEYPERQVSIHDRQDIRARATMIVASRARDLMRDHAAPAPSSPKHHDTDETRQCTRTGIWNSIVQIALRPYDYDLRDFGLNNLTAPKLETDQFLDGRPTHSRSYAISQHIAC